ncbi:hypothetical protein [Celerinatantimonas sp. MCCC 1A17872]|uniref:hypothetical protein n=1 Tax=Celerinatantimonas sp. MCCC 1A17872 TaxID=3177514 RepID=UPI0038CA81CB
MNKKQSSTSVSKLAISVLLNKAASKTAKSLAGSVLSQTSTTKQTGAKMEDIASKALSSDKYNSTTKILAGSVLSQSNKDR